MTNKDKKAIDSLIRHKDKLKDPNNFDSSWVSKLSDLLLKYLGSESLLYASAKGWYSYARKANMQQIDSCLKILENAVEFIEDNGIKKETSFWRTLENTNKSDFDIVIENNKLKDSLSTIRKSFKISDKKSYSDTTTYKKSSNDKKE